MPGGRPSLFACRPGRDEAVLELNQEAKARMRCPTLLEVVPGATHLFEEPGALEAVATLATRWFRAHLGGVVED